MTNTRQIKPIIRTLVERNSDLMQFDGSSLWIKPVHHVGRRILFERGSDSGRCWPEWNIIDVFRPGRDMKIERGSYHWLLDRPEASRDRLWSWSDPSMIGDAISVIENQALPFLRSLDTLEKYAAFYRGKFDRYNREWPDDRLIIDIALGDLETARRSWIELAPLYTNNKYPNGPIYQLRRTKVITVAEPLLAGDRLALAKILHGWEADNIRGTKIEPYWEPTPFPLETGGT